MKFVKMQGAGNDFVLMETGSMQHDWSRVAVAMCDRHFGVGADGLLLLLPSDKADFRMRIFNPDGSEARACGNGLRCLVKYIKGRRLVSREARHVLVETLSGVRKVKINNGTAANIQASMGMPKLEAENIPVIIGQSTAGMKPVLSHSITVGGRELLLSFVSMGNPHAVFFSQEPVSNFPLTQLGPKVEQYELFPVGVNFEVARVINRQQIEARVWERGVGETLACGSGACAITVAARLHDYIDNKVDIRLPGGILVVEWDGVGEVFLSGPAEVVFTGEWSGQALG